MSQKHVRERKKNWSFTGTVFILHYISNSIIYNIIYNKFYCIYHIMLIISYNLTLTHSASDLQVTDDAVVLSSIQTTGWWGWELSSSTHHQVTQLGTTRAARTLVLEVLEVLELTHWKKNYRHREIYLNSIIITRRIYKVDNEWRQSGAVVSTVPSSYKKY